MWASATNTGGPEEPRLAHIDPSTNQIVATIPLEVPVWDLAAVLGAVWAEGYVPSGPVVLLPIGTNQVISTITLGDYVGPLPPTPRERG